MRGWRLRILLTSYTFHPSIGGLETASMLLASGLAERGYDVTVVTQEPGPTEGYRFSIVRQPTFLQMLRLVRDADLVWQNQVSLRRLWAVLLVRRPLIIMHHIWLTKDLDAGPRFETPKRLACRLGCNVFVSAAMRDDVRLHGVIIPNTYDEQLFRVIPGIERDRDVAFLGRIVRPKGADIVVDAVAQLSHKGRRLRATIIGVGPEDGALKARAAKAGIPDLIDFPGPKRGEELVQLLNRHRILVVPSRWEEPFGIVALEGLACGCVTIVANSGALPEVIGPCGPTVPKNDAAALAAELDRLTSRPDILADYRRQAPLHLTHYTKTAMLDACEAVIREAAATFGSCPAERRTITKAAAHH
ncbi:MAG: glycosyltransferase [Pseudolabrys sp.]|jgi:glycogen(starch) synthase